MKTRTPLFRIDRLLVAALALLFPLQAQAQLTNTNWIYNFGTSTSVWTSNAASTTFLPAPPTGGGTARVRVGSGGGSFTMTNVSGFGSGSALVGVAPTGTSVNKFSIYDWSNPTPTFSLSFDMRLTGGSSGTWTFAAGDGAIFSDNQDPSTNGIFNTMRMSFGASGAVGVSNRVGNTFSAIADTGISQSNNYSISIFGNNASVSTNYYQNDASYSLASGTWDLWVGGTRVATNLAKTSMAAGANIDSFMFWGVNSTGNVATISLDNFIYFNGLNQAPPPPVGDNLYWTANGSTLGGLGTWDTTGTTWSASDTSVSGGVWDSTKTAAFTNSADVVTVGAVSANAGIRFSTTGYTLSSGTLTLGGTAIASNTITTDSAVTATINSVLVGSAGMTKAGAGTLVLGGANNYTGGTLISAGALQGNTTSLQGAITNNAAIVFDQASDGTFSTVLSGSGTLVKIGASTLTLSGGNSFSGALTISNGAVRLSNATGAGTTAGGIAVVNGAALELTGGIAVGAEALTLNGSGISSSAALRNISGDNSYAGAITLAAASRINSDSGTLTIDVASGNAISGAQNLTIGGSGHVTINDPIATSTGILTKDGTGTATLTAANTYSGGTLISEGTLQIGSGGSSGSLAGAITNNATLLFNRSGALTQGTVISGEGVLNKTGAGTLTLSVANTYSGATTISNGAVRISNNAGLGTTAAGTTVVSGAALELTGGLTVGAESLSLTGTGISSAGALRNIAGANSFAGAVFLGGATDVASDAGTLTLSGGITGTGQALTIEGSGDVVITNTGINTGASGSLAKTGTGALVLAVASDYTGATTIASGGEIIAAHANALGTTSGGTTVSSGGALWLSNSIAIGAESLSLIGTGVTSDGALRNVSGNNTLGGAITLGGATTIQSDSGTSLTLSGGISGTGSALTIRGTGSTTISGTGINTGIGGTLIKNQSGILTITASSDYAGGSVLSVGGTTRVGHNSALGTGSITTSDGIAIASDSATARTLTNNFVINGATTFGEASVGTGNLTLDGTFNLGGSPRTVNVANTLTTINGVITGTSGNSLTKSGTGSLVLNAANTYSGATTVSAGTLALGAAGSIASSTITVDSGAALDLTAKSSGYALGSATLGGVGTVTTAVGQTLSIGSGSTIRPATASTSGTLTVSGLTFGSGGTYAFSIGNVTGSAGTAWDLLSVGSTFDITATSESKFTINVGGNGGNPTGFSNTGNYSWDILTLASGSIGSFDASKFNLVNGFSGSNGTLSLNSDGSKLTLNYAAGIDQAIFTSNSSSLWRTGSNWDGGAVPTSAYLATFSSASSLTTVSINMNDAGGNQPVGAIDMASTRANALTINNNSGTVAGTLTLNGLALNSVENVILRNNSSHVLTLTNGASRSMGVALGNATDNVVLIDSTGGITISSIISGSGRKLTKDGSGAGILTLSGANTFSGGIDLDAGTLRLSSTSAAGTGVITQADATSTLEINTTGTVANVMDIYNISTLQTVTLSGNKTLRNATFTVASGTTTTESGNLSGTGGITKEGAGTLLVTGNNTFTGATAVNAGVLELASTVGGALASTSEVNVGENAILLISQSNQVNNSAEITLSGGTIRRGSGVSEVFGALVLEGNSSLDFGTGATGTLSFTSYTPSALLTVNNFLPGNKLTFTSNLSFDIENSALFSFQGGFDWDWDQTTANTFTITAIPEPSTYLAAAGLLSLMLWPSRKRLLKDAKKILGLTPPMRDRLAARREQKMKFEP